MIDSLSPDQYKIYKYIPDYYRYVLEDAPIDVDYVKGLTIRLNPIHKWDKGRIVETCWYAQASLDALGEEVGTDLIVKEVFAYTLDAVGLARHRAQTITWILADDSEGDSKLREKVYNNAASRTEGRRRRRNVIDNMSIAVVGLLAATQYAGDMAAAIAEGKLYMASVADETSMYVEDGASLLKDHITADATKTWLDQVIDGNGTTIRM